jgi:anaerobic selenocysteine-containing dehydrogenase
MERPVRRVTYCRMCPATCGLLVDVEDNRVVRAVGDVDNPLTRGFSCPKGRHIGDFLSSPERHRTCLKRMPDGTYDPIDPDGAIAEIAAQLDDIAAAHGPEAIGYFAGTQAAFASLTGPMASRWWAGVGSAKSFGTMTIDQSAMWVADGRMGMWAAGDQRFADADVWMLCGTNPVVSLQGGNFTEFPIHDPIRRLVEAKRRGLKLIVVDPRRTEVAAQANIHIQLVPGSDAFLYAAMLHVLLRDGYIDTDFCSRWVNGLGELRAGVEPVTPHVAAWLCGVGAADIEAAARMFGAARKGMALTGTGPDMGPWSNLAEHLCRALNVVGGRYPREGDRLPGFNVLASDKTRPAQAIGPDRTWERGFRSRFGLGRLKGSLPTASLPDEILEPGEDRIRALVVSAGNPAAAIPDQLRAVQALSALELLVTVDPFPTETARLAHYVIAPVMHLERPDTTRVFEALFEEPFAMYTPAIVEPPPGVIDDWEFFLKLAWAQGRTVDFAGRAYPPGSRMPSTEELLASMSSRGRIALDQLKRHEHGVLVPDAAPSVAGPAREDADGRFELLPPDAAEELATALRDAPSEFAGDRPYRLIVRRSKNTMNSLGRRVPPLARRPYNPCFAHPEDLADLGIEAGQLVDVTSAHGTICAVVEPDGTLRRGVVSMTHCFGGLPGVDDDPLLYGANPARLLSLDVDTQTINRMPRMSAVPVTLNPVGRS